MSQSPSADPKDPFRDDLRSGETLADAFYVDETAIGVTDERLLVHRNGVTRAVDLTNVREVRQLTRQDRGHLLSALQWGGLAVFLLAAWRFAPLEGLVAPVEAPPGGGFERLYATVATLVDLLGYVDEAFLVVALLAVGWAGWQVASYLRGREELLEVTVAGADPIQLSPPRDLTAVDRLRGAIDARSDDATD